MTDTPTVEEYARSYVDVLNGPANGWGQHVCPETGHVSHEMYRLGVIRYGGTEFENTLTAIFKKDRESLQWDKSLYTKLNAATQREVNRVNTLARNEFPQEYENEWGNRTTLRAKVEYLMALRTADQRGDRL